MINTGSHRSLLDKAVHFLTRSADFLSSKCRVLFNEYLTFNLSHL